MWEITCHIFFFPGYVGTTSRRYGGILEEFLCGSEFTTIYHHSLFNASNNVEFTTIVLCHCFIFNIPFMHSTTKKNGPYPPKNRLGFCEAVASNFWRFKPDETHPTQQRCKKQTRKTNQNQSSNDPLVAGGWFKNNILEGTKNLTRNTCINIYAIKSSVSHMAIDMCMILGGEIVGYPKLPYDNVLCFRR